MVVAGPLTHDFPQQQTLIVNPARLHLTVEIEGTTTRAGPTKVQLDIITNTNNSSSESSSSSNNSSNNSISTDDFVEDTTRHKVVREPLEDNDSESTSSISSDSDEDYYDHRVKPTKKKQKAYFDGRARLEQTKFPYCNTPASADESNGSDVESDSVDEANHRACRRQREREMTRARCMEAAIERERLRHQYEHRDIATMDEAEYEAEIMREAKAKVQAAHWARMESEARTALDNAEFWLEEEIKWNEKLESSKETAQREMLHERELHRSKCRSGHRDVVDSNEEMWQEGPNENDTDKWEWSQVDVIQHDEASRSTRVTVSDRSTKLYLISIGDKREKVSSVGYI